MAMQDRDPNHTKGAANSTGPDGAGDIERNPATGVYHVQHDDESTARLTTTAIHALATVAEVDVSNAEKALADVINRDALDFIFHEVNDDGHAEASVSALGHEVRLWSDGSIEIEPLNGSYIHAR